MITQVKALLEDTFDFVGTVSMASYLEALKNQSFYDAYRLDESLRDYQTIAVVGLAYPDQTVPYKGKGYGILSRYSYGTDYHIVMNDRFKSLHHAFNTMNVKSQSFVDVSPINERLAASLTHQGYIGKNQAFIHKDFGPYVYLGTVLLDVDMADDVFPIDDCLDCRKCIDACPTDALNDGFDQTKCLSHITQAKQALSSEEISHIQKMVYGCDVCYQVCPKRLDVKRVCHPEFEPSGIENVDLIKLLQMSNKEYQAIYKNNASSWRGATIIRRNALAILYHQNHQASIPVIKESLKRYPVDWYQKTAQTILKKFKEKKS
jgi:epoxyqueuosine reductase